MKGKLATRVLLAAFGIGVALLLYPTVSDYWNSLHQSRAIAGYAEAVAEIDDGVYAEIWQAAQRYNETLLRNEDRLQPTEEETVLYNSLLDAAGNGIMGYIEVPAIGVSLPIYHGTDEAVLQIAIGSGHRGLPSAKLFTDLDKLEVGDSFQLRVLDEVLTYEVDKIHIVEPHEVDLLEIEPGQDLCTLVTCTPYGINSHRLLVRGHRVETQEAAAAIRVTADAMQIDPILVAPAVALPMLAVLLVWMLVRTRRKNPNEKGNR